MATLQSPGEDNHGFPNPKKTTAVVYNQSTTLVNSTLTCPSLEQSIVLLFCQWALRICSLFKGPVCQRISLVWASTVFVLHPARMPKTSVTVRPYWQCETLQRKRAPGVGAPAVAQKKTPGTLVSKVQMKWCTFSHQTWQLCASAPETTDVRERVSECHLLIMQPSFWLFKHAVWTAWKLDAPLGTYARNYARRSVEAPTRDQFQNCWLLWISYS